MMFHNLRPALEVRRLIQILNRTRPPGIGELFQSEWNTKSYKFVRSVVPKQWWKGAWKYRSFLFAKRLELSREKGNRIPIIKRTAHIYTYIHYNNRKCKTKGSYFLNLLIIRKRNKIKKKKLSIYSSIYTHSTPRADSK
ncbi:unnamed protein product [Xylocopa violacea]|uniref:Uncharacterized protein n=1 Tax=Xylocopa violacea TaxID=135666 RepID=A0ABP1NQS9_XYLVO